MSTHLPRRHATRSVIPSEARNPYLVGTDSSSASPLRNDKNVASIPHVPDMGVRRVLERGYVCQPIVDRHRVAIVEEPHVDDVTGHVIYDLAQGLMATLQWHCREVTVDEGIQLRAGVAGAVPAPVRVLRHP